MKTFIITSVLFFSFLAVHAQLYQDAGGIAYTIHSKSELSKVLPSSPLANRKFSFNTVDIWVPLPITHIGKVEVFGTVNYQMIDISYDELPLDPNRPEKIYDLKSVIFARYHLKNNWSILALALPTIATDFKESFSGNDVLLQGAIALTRKLKIKSDLTIGLGIFSTYVFGETQIIPAFTIDYKSANGKWIGQGYWPRFNFFRNLNDNAQLGIAISIDGSNYNLKNYTNNNGQEIDNAKFSVVHTGLQFNHRLAGNFWVQLQGGIAINNTYQLSDKKVKTVIDGDYSLKEMAYAKTMVTYRFK